MSSTPRLPPAPDSTADVSWVDHSTSTELWDASAFYSSLPEPTAEELAWLARLRRRIRRGPRQKLV